MKTIRVVCAILINEGNEVLCCQRDNMGPLALKWEFPGGKIEEDETKEEALVREIMEELNLDIEIQRFFLQVKHHYPSFDLIMDSYICRIIGGDFELKEHHDALWLPPKKLNELDFAEADIPIVQKLVRCQKLFSFDKWQ